MQLTFGDGEGLGQRKRTRREVFLAEMDQVVPWKTLLALIDPHYPKMGSPGRQPYPLATMLRIHFLQQWYALSDPSMEEALYEIPTLRRFARMGGRDSIPDETTILIFRRLLETHDLAPRILERVNAHLARKGQSLRPGTIVDATIIAAPSSTKNKDGQRDPEMHQTKKGNQWHFGMKAHIGVDDESGLVHHVECTAANVADVTQVHKLLHGQEDTIGGDSGYTGAENREELKDVDAAFLIAKKPSVVRAMKNKRERRQEKRWERHKASARAKVEHPFRVIKCQFHYIKVRYRGLMKNNYDIVTKFEPECAILMTERTRLAPLEESSFTNEYLTSSFVSSFYDLPADTRSRINADLVYAGDGITPSLSDGLFKLLYEKKFFTNSRSNYRLQCNTSVTKITKSGAGLRLTARCLLTDRLQECEVDAVILATGYTTAAYSLLKRLESAYPELAERDLDRDYSMRWRHSGLNNIFLQNGARHTHGVPDPYLSLAAWRSSVIANALAGRELFRTHHRPTLVTFPCAA